MHWEKAGDPGKARSCYLGAARRARDRYDHTEAERLYQSYFGLATGDSGESLIARSEYGDILERTGQYAAALREHETVTAKTGDDRLRIVDLRKKALILTIQGELRDARQAYEEALALSAPYPLEQAGTLNDKAFLILNQGDVIEAERLYTRACNLVYDCFPVLRDDNHHLKRDATDAPLDQAEQGRLRNEAKRVLAGSLSGFGIINQTRGDPNRALEYYLKCIAIYEEIGDRRSMGLMSGNIGNVHHYRGDLDRALEFHRKNLTISEETGDRRSIGTASGNLGVVYHECGDLNRALDFYRKNLSISEEIGDRCGIGVTTGNIGTLYHDCGDLDLALEYYLKHLAISEELNYRRGIAAATDNLGTLYLDRGDLVRAREFLQKSLTLCREMGLRVPEAEELLALSEIDRLTGDPVGAYAQNNRAMELFRDADNELRVADCWCARAECDITAGNLMTARDSLARA
jgi:tetratricopeptide (TPR) repeat protein